MKPLVLETSGVPAKLWVRDLNQVEGLAMEQIKRMATVPGMFKWLAIMPDVHVGKGAVVGSVAANKEMVVPNIVGVDIGCGVCAADTGLVWEPKRMGKEFWRSWQGLVMREVPLGFGRLKEKADWEGFEVRMTAGKLQQLVKEVAPLQLGSLGGGNHFIEGCREEGTGRVWLTVHSGSRHTGLQIAMHHAGVAAKLDERKGWKGLPDLGYLPLDSEEGRDYVTDMNWAIDFALENRFRMMEVMLAAFERVCGRQGVRWSWTSGREGIINIHHNFANGEKHYGAEVMVHRKGATQARQGQLGVVPGSMGAATYIVQGLGNPESFESCAHGAGRTMSRTQAKKRWKQEDLQEQLTGTFTKASRGIIDEAPGAYKNIDEVMDLQSDLVAVKHKLMPIMTVKGEGRN
ncbi:MAG: hypothetical protein UX78_C0022G0018 [Candidatus Amesbacteria bacterium GW2011_GWA2_47_11]|uniref:3'-phosphate/5'-hydroxy nucleic acid ligase n=3 Tax=Candidatus Amesiibacteriota TaxID=1752730 RepID=A0A1F4Z8Z8_9BACT|nr:MAG: hypothetical protein UX78_C0022G0018 [Candidatus Amesbacteria bacterium GW2011_GWA2_47_11]OGC91313.1 MAG: hypothetical protein A2V48_00115 [Candidatus Amesbacteria bacterium RBG_19FT_COMBO_48_16]OGC97681.1 MAG: hypothetical protein A2W16_03495 [Candidatus Amesbacteria bacterium RBG_16_48_31]OGC99932.1 MAG: hypothetical protein A2702_00185 [Candidatus Amesbacteria bacterium RIFCSPHIGHO2_01_FULL_48_75]OGD02733.1 MAG: hypothetical protein A3E17_02905 [Candidatus Amesbacteria bacterium RIFC